MTTQSNFTGKQFARVGRIIPSPFKRHIIGAQLKTSSYQNHFMSKL